MSDLHLMTWSPGNQMITIKQMYTPDGKHYKSRDVTSIDGITIHRCGIDLKSGVTFGHDGPSVADVFYGRDNRYPEVSDAVGGVSPYTYYIGGNAGPAEHDGQVWQAMALNYIGWHARAVSRTRIGIGLIADARVKALSYKQYWSLVELTSSLCMILGLNPKTDVLAHGETPGSHDGSKAFGKPNACPGDLLDMHELRRDIKSSLMTTNIQRARSIGIVYSGA